MSARKSRQPVRADDPHTHPDTMALPRRLRRPWLVILAKRRRYAVPKATNTPYVAAPSFRGVSLAVAAQRPYDERPVIEHAIAKRARRDAKRAESDGRQKAATFDQRATWELRRQHAEMYGNRYAR